MILRRIMEQTLGWLRIIPKSQFTVRTIPVHPKPEEIKMGLMLVVANKKNIKWACFRCPGGCGEIILLSLSLTHCPRWSVSVDWINRPTIYPSVRQINECRCHFWIKRGNVKWCQDSGQLSSMK